MSWCQLQICEICMSMPSTLLPYQLQQFNAAWRCMWAAIGKEIDTPNDACSYSHLIYFQMVLLYKCMHACIDNHMCMLNFAHAFGHLTLLLWTNFFYHKIAKGFWSGIYIVMTFSFLIATTSRGAYIHSLDCWFYRGVLYMLRLV